MRPSRLCLSLAGLALVAGFVYTSSTTLSTQNAVDPASAMHWRQIGPTRAGRAATARGRAEPAERVLHRVRQRRRLALDRLRLELDADLRPRVDRARSARSRLRRPNPKVIYVGTGAGIIRPDLSTGNGVYKSTDAGQDLDALGLFDSQMIAMDRRRSARSQSALRRRARAPLRAERRARRVSIDRRREDVPEGALQGRVHQRERRAHRSRRSEHGLCRAVGAAAELHRRRRVRRRGRRHLQVDRRRDDVEAADEGLPDVLQANLGLAPSNPKVLYAMVGRASAAPRRGAGRGGGRGGGERRPLQVRRRRRAVVPGGRAARRRRHAHAGQPAARRESAAATFPRSPSIRRIPTSIYSCSTVLWRSEDGGLTWSAVRGAPGGDDYQGVWVNPNNTDIILAVSDQGAVISGNRGASWSNWYTQPTGAMYHATTDNAFPYRVCSGQQDSGSACVDSRGNDGEITFRDWRPVGIQEYGEAAPDPKNPDLVYGSSRNNVYAVQPEDGPDEERRPELRRPGGRQGDDVYPQRAHDAARVVAGRTRTCSSTRRTRCS